MSDSEEGTSSQPCSIAVSFSRASKQFKEFYIALAAKDCAVADQISLSQISDEYGRFRVWASASGADRKGRGSLDDSLRNDSDLGSIILDLLDDIYDDLERGTRLALDLAGPDSHENHDQGGNRRQDPMDDISSESEASSDEETSVHVKNGDMRRLSSIIFDQIRSLYKTSALLRRPKIHDKYIRSAAKTSEKQKSSYYSSWDRAHVAEKMKQWALDMNMKYETLIDTGDFLCARAADSNTRRREQLNYWQKHPGDPDVSGESEMLEVPANLLDEWRKEPQPVIQIPLSPYAQEHVNVDAGVEPAPSRKTTQSFSTVTQSVLNDNERFSGRPKTIYAPSAKGNGHATRVPDRPKVRPGIVKFQCPYCYTYLDSKAMQDRELWKKHVFRDLRPYICTFSDCLNPEKMYVTKHDWLYHEMQIHRRRWICAGVCNASFDSKSSIEQHMRQKHAETFTEIQLPIVLDLCEREMEPTETVTCAFCPAEMTLLDLQGHVANHLEELALFALPVTLSGQSRDLGSNEIGSVVYGSNKLGDLSPLGSFSEAGDQMDPTYDINHVREKYGHAKRSTEWLIERLGKAVTLRRQYLKYRKDHHAKLSQDWDNTSESGILQGKGDEQPEPAASVAYTKATTLAPRIERDIEPSDEAASFGSQTAYATHVSTEEASYLRVPQPPMPFEYVKPFECPYCYTIQIVQHRTAWKRHVFRDLKPYVCTSEECDMIMFPSRTEWFTHELDHMKEWRCPLCQQDQFASQAAFSAHLTSTHAIPSNDSQHQALLGHSKIPVDKIPHTACKLCDEWESSLLSGKMKRLSVTPGTHELPYGTVKQFRRHLGRHMEQLALFALPRETLDEDAESEVASLEGGEEDQPDGLGPEFIGNPVK
ncbi:hypothetical protein DL98DRAFT_578562 [Cadophora sp. DSE1049]|nr:hypothetical protein DL98DRAFT_578562 [Cadophora sp. DSE1049]